MGARKEDGARLFSVRHNVWTRGNGHKVEYKKFGLNTRGKKSFLTVIVIKQWNNLLSDVEASLSMKIFKTQLDVVLSDSALSREIGLDGHPGSLLPSTIP